MSKKIAIRDAYGEALKELGAKNKNVLEEKLERASKIKNLDGVELCYPADFKNVENLIKLIKEYKLGVSAVNFRSRRTGK